MKRTLRLFALTAVLIGSASAAGSASTLKVLHRFCRTAPCKDGNAPTWSLALTPDGRVLGAVLGGARFNNGGVFELRQVAGDKHWHESLAYSFCRKKHCKDGNALFNSLTMDAAGALYGATQGGGHLGKGVVFKLTPDGSGGWRYSTLYRFCQIEKCLDGAGGDGALVFDAQGNIYGTTYGGGSGDKGVVYELSPAARDHEWTEKVLYNFCTQANCADGNQPLTGVTYVGAASGTPYDGVSPLFGTTSFGGNGGDPGSGVVFSLTPHGGTWQESVLYAFCPGGDPCADGNEPAQAGSLSFDAQGRIYGATQWGGTATFGGGVLFRLNRHGGKWEERVLHTFCTGSCEDGLGPNANPIMDAAGNLFGTASGGGAGSNGVIYELVAGPHPTLTTLHDFCVQTCGDGRNPQSALVMDANGDLFGTAMTGGDNGNGTAFELTP
jgi:uncharacterized repeat protein (TIGR03803 family)